MSNYSHPEALAEHASDPNVRFLEDDVDTAAYEQGHVAGAVGLNWKTELQQHPVRDLISKEQLEALLSKHGVTAHTTIAVYGDNNNWFAAWCFWLLKYCGHKDVRLVNGGRVKWIAERRPLTTEVPTHEPARYVAGRPDGSIRALRDYVLDATRGGACALVDVRSPKEFSGELLAPENLPQRGRAARRAHQGRGQPALVHGCRGGRSIQAGLRAPRSGARLWTRRHGLRPHA